MATVGATRRSPRRARDLSASAALRAASSSAVTTLAATWTLTTPCRRATSAISTSKVDGSGVAERSRNSASISAPVRPASRPRFSEAAEIR